MSRIAQISYQHGPVALALSACGFLSTHTLAQDPGGTAQASSVLEETLVTARRKSNVEAAQDIPLSITALQGDVIEKNFMLNLTEVGTFVPGAQFNDNGTMPGTANFILRGMGFFGSIPSDEPAVGVFLDGVYLGVNAGALSNVEMLESVEVLRGPQGTLFGRNVTGGAIVLRSKRPTEEFEGRVSARVENFDGYRGSLYFGGPVADSVSASLAISYREAGDFLENTFPGGDDRGEMDNLFIRPVVSYEPNEELQLTLIYEYQQQNSDGMFAKDLISEVELDDFEIAHNFNGDTRGDFETHQLTLDVQYELGSGVASLIAAWRDVESSAFFDGDGSARDLLSTSQDIGQEQFSVEATYAWSPSDGFDLTSGIYYFDQEIENDEGRFFGDLALNVTQIAGGALEADSFAVFSQGDIDLAGDWTLTLGARYTTETKSASVASYPSSLLAPGDCDPITRVCEFAFNDEEDWDYISGLAALKWQFNDDAQAYVSFTRGQRSGGYNLRHTEADGATPGPFDQETADAFEAGIKSELFDRRLRLNVAAYYNQYDDLQRTVFAPGAGIAQVKLNAADAVIQGLEVETTALIGNNWTFNGWFSYVDPSYNSFIGFDVDGDGVADPQLAEDLDFASVPNVSAFGQITYTKTLGNGMGLTLNGSARYQGSRFGDERNSTELDSFTRFDANASLTSRDETWKLSLYGKNLTDEEYADFVIVSGGAIRGLWGVSRARTYGVELSYMF